jgi:hypothetical protein
VKEGEEKFGNGKRRMRKNKVRVREGCKDETVEGKLRDE